MFLKDQFAEDPHAKKFIDVKNDYPVVFEEVVNFFEDESRQKRMIESELHHNRPPLAGVIKELESIGIVDRFFQQTDGHKTMRLRQAVGVLVRIIMENKQWKTTGKKGPLGTREKLSAPSNEPGVYHNKSGLSRWFTRAERYVPKEGSPDYEEWKKLNRSSDNKTAGTENGVA